MLLLIADIIATAIFAYIGIKIGLDKSCNWCIILLSGYLPAFGGGLLRDILLYKQVPLVFIGWNKLYLLIPIVVYVVIKIGEIK